MDKKFKALRVVGTDADGFKGIRINYLFCELDGRYQVEIRENGVFVSAKCALDTANEMNNIAKTCQSEYEAEGHKFIFEEAE